MFSLEKGKSTPPQKKMSNCRPGAGVNSCCGHLGTGPAKGRLSPLLTLFLPLSVSPFCNFVFQIKKIVFKSHYSTDD